MAEEELQRVAVALENAPQLQTMEIGDVYSNST
jgi:hypothetical protein